MDLQESRTSGVFVEFLDALGNSAGTAVYFDWKLNRVPAVGEVVRCRLQNQSGLRCRNLAGYVKRRTVELQQSDDGQPCVWVHLVVRVAGHSDRATSRFFAGELSFSAN